MKYRRHEVRVLGESSGGINTTVSVPVLQTVNAGSTPACRSARRELYGCSTGLLIQGYRVRAPGGAPCGSEATGRPHELKPRGVRVRLAPPVPVPDRPTEGCVALNHVIEVRILVRQLSLRSSLAERLFRTEEEPVRSGSEAPCVRGGMVDARGRGPRGPQGP